MDCEFEKYCHGQEVFFRRLLASLEGSARFEHVETRALLAFRRKVKLALSMVEPNHKAIKETQTQKAINSFREIGERVDDDMYIITPRLAYADSRGNSHFGLDISSGSMQCDM